MELKNDVQKIGTLLKLWHQIVTLFVWQQSALQVLLILSGGDQLIAFVNNLHVELELL